MELALVSDCFVGKVGRPKRQTKLRAWVDANGVKLEELASKARVTEAYLETIISGTKKPSVKVALRIKAATGGAIDLDALLDPEERLS